MVPSGTNMHCHAQAPVSMWMANHIEHTEVGERSHPFCGQMGKVFFFSEAITATDVQTLHALGPNFLPKKKSEYLRAFFAPLRITTANSSLG